MNSRVHDREAHFWAGVDKSGGPTACWPWTRYTDERGYGSLGWFEDGKRVQLRAHRAAFQFTHGYLPKGRSRACLVIRHRCDNPVCCNPDHLEIGTHQQNVQDCWDRNRAVPPPTRHGEDHPRSKLTASAVRAARAAHRDGTSNAELARRFGVGETTMAHALARRTWRNA